MKTAVLVILLALMIMSVTSRRVLRPQRPLEGKLSLFDAMVEHLRDIFLVKVDLTHCNGIAAFVTVKENT